MLQVGTTNKLIAGIGHPQSTENFVRLQYVDNTLILCKAFKQYIKNLKFVIYSVELITGSKNSFPKSSPIGIGIKDK